MIRKLQYDVSSGWEGCTSRRELMGCFINMSVVGYGRNTFIHVSSHHELEIVFAA